MIAFACPTCHKSFSVPDSYAGRKARCKGCRNEVVVPAAAVAPPTKPPLRVRRLLADADAVRAAFAEHPIVRLVSAEGDPPDTYAFEFKLAGLERDAKGKIVTRHTHRAEVKLGADYPRLPPVCRMLTPSFHPNIDASHICIGDHWTAGERLIDLIARIGEMLAYQAYNIRSPLDGEAAMWADLNAAKLPTDPRPVHA
jgi:ubiquitin-protein ligase